MLPINKSIKANQGNYNSTQRNKSAIKYLIIHYTANDGDKALNNAIYFANNVIKASAHYFVDDSSIYQSVEPLQIAWAVGGSKYTNTATTGGGKYYGIATNSNSISIELTDMIKDGTIKPSAATIKNALDLTKQLMVEYNVDAAHVIRHFDVTGKPCPDYWCGTAAKNLLWETEFHSKLTTTYTLGWNQDNNGWWYADSKTTYFKNTWQIINHSKYYFNQDGYAVKGWQTINNTWYYFEPISGAAKECALYVTDSNGVQTVGIF